MARTILETVDRPGIWLRRVWASSTLVVEVDAELRESWADVHLARRAPDGSGPRASERVSLDDLVRARGAEPGAGHAVETDTDLGAWTDASVRDLASVTDVLRGQGREMLDELVAGRDWLHGPARGWRRFLRRLVSEVEFTTPAGAMAIAAAEARLGVRFPDQLRALLLETDGVTYGLVLDSGERLESVGYVVLPLDGIVQATLEIRERDGALPGGAGGLLVAADPQVDGILFGHPIDDSGRVAPGVVVWRPIDGDQWSVGVSLSVFLGRWWTGAISV